MRPLLSTALIAVLTLYLACTPKTGNKTTATPNPPGEPAMWDSMGKPLSGEEEEPLEYNVLDEMTIEPQAGENLDSLRPYNASHTFEVDLIHTRVEISFDWAKKRANGKATLTMRPWFYATDKVTLDAKNFDIQSVTFADEKLPSQKGEGQGLGLKYDYNNAQLTIHLGKTYSRTEEFKVAITYTAKPDERDSFGGSAAITSDKGLYFINADGAEKDKPKQIWTQGETESNSYWMPTVDKPNERCTQEMYITVEDKYKTLSNGLLLSSKKNADGTRTDYWKMDKPHAPYLFMMAIGEYAVVKDKWRGIDVDYYVEPKFEAHARDIYPYTTEMLEFFSTKLNYTYPWSKFSQIIVRDYVSGAMENTTAVIFGEFMQKTKRELLDDHLTNEKVVAHEMFHQWFGDLVTTESWANLTLNEGFANYSEYLWIENKYGRDAADEHLMTEQQGYFYSAGDGGHPLIHFGYENREDMFDAHSYNKGGCILHMLRQQVGDEAFFAALNRYLKKNEYTEVESHELRLAFEDVTGQDLNWFFNQWFLGAGHPLLDLEYGWDVDTKKASITVTQNQDGQQVARIFDLPLEVDIYEVSGKSRRENIRVTKRSQTFTFDCASKPALINFDATKTLLCQKNDNHNAQEWAFMYRNAPLYRDRVEALQGLQAEPSVLTEAVFNEALTDKFHGIRQQALMADGAGAAGTLPIIARLAETDPEPGVRAQAISILGRSGDKQYIPVIQKNMGNEQAYSVVGSALSALQKLDPAAAREASKILQSDDSEAFTPVLAELYADNPDRSNLSFFERKLDKADGFGAFPFFDNYQKFIIGLGDAALLDASVEKFKLISLNLQTSEWRRFGATKAIADLRNHYREKSNAAKVAELEAIITEIRAKETDPTLKLYYDMF
ncbi:MAG: M1 family aminopeptidase [Saprospiraceae bacterium]|nr:M1 family aminopeptidase [Saprospiraceae bacterium]